MIENIEISFRKYFAREIKIEHKLPNNHAACRKWMPRCSYVVACMVCYEKILLVTSLIVTPYAAAEVEPRNSCGRSHNVDRGRMYLYENKRCTCVCEISLVSNRLDFPAFPAKYSLSRKILLIRFIFRNVNMTNVINL